jgi:hypothetical protein
MRLEGLPLGSTQMGMMGKMGEASSREDCNVFVGLTLRRFTDLPIGHPIRTFPSSSRVDHSTRFHRRVQGTVRLVGW